MLVLSAKIGYFCHCRTIYVKKKAHRKTEKASASLDWEADAFSA